MSDDFLDKYFAQLQQKKIEQHKQQQKANGGYADADISRHLMNKAINQDMGQQSSGKNCKLVPGAKFYRNLAVNGFYPKFPIVREGGIVPNNGQTFEYKGNVRCVLVEGNNSIDFSAIDENSSNLIELTQVSSPFIGTVLVEKRHVIQEGKQNNILLG